MTTGNRVGRRVGFVLAVVGVLLVAGCTGGTGGTDEAETNQQLVEAREATASYQALDKAKDDGYVKFSLPVPGMGIHYLHESAISSDATLAMDRSLDRTDPEILVYQPEGQQESNARLVSVEYAVPVADGETSPPPQAVGLFDEADAEDWHPHPSRHELRLGDGWTIHAECHYEGGPGVWMGERPDGEFVLLTPEGQVGTWNGSVVPDQCPTEIDGEPLPPLLIVHEKLWTLHAWVWLDNPEGVFHPTNPQVMS